MVRNPKSVAVSYFSQRTRSKMDEYDSTFAGFFPVFLQEPCKLSSIRQNINGLASFNIQLLIFCWSCLMFILQICFIHKS